jgi:chloramphenicol 3-O phosphotransferase
MNKEPVRIIYLNGPSSSGKTTLAKALQDAFEEPFLHVSMDKIIGWMPEKINAWTGGEAPLGYSWKKDVDPTGNLIQELQAGPYAKKIGKTFQEVVLTLAKMGHHIIADDFTFGVQQLEEWKNMLKGFQVIWVGVNAPLSVLEQREKERGNRMPGSARAQFHKVHVDASYDLEVNTHLASLSENVEKIKSLALSPTAQTKQVTIRPLRQEDIETLSELYFPWSTREETLAKWLRNLQEQQEGTRLSSLIEYQNEIVGYGNLLQHSEYPMFRKKNIPEINDVWIYEPHRKKGFATLLIQHLEESAQAKGHHHIGIGVGLYRDYGSAQKLYFRLGYVPDGEGITYKGQSTIPGQQYPLDDDLILWLLKTLI